MYMSNFYGKNFIGSDKIMDISNMKNIIVLKNLPSNLIDEAIVVLKHNISSKIYNKVKDGQGDGKEKKSNNDYVVNEAQMHIAEYISNLNHKNNLNETREWEKKYIKLKRITKLLAVISALGIIVNLIK